ncbi:MAG: phosphatidate cytidylyltransferase [Bacteroidia bacterium]|nr:phosphatidate cytidylyltransferase [Bacteroidia bacterium]MCZ2247793.1 phosphatidate cytidylyltransferase [Bacteroidia bacterium]
MSNFWQRAVTGTVYVAVLVGMTYFHPLSLGILFLVVTILGCNEFFNIAIKGNNTPQKIMGTLLASWSFVLSFMYVFYELPPKFMMLIIVMICLVFIGELYRKKNNPFRQIAFTLTGAIWVGLPMSLIPFLVNYQNQFHPEILLGCFYLVWANDTGAYLLGSKIGKRKLFERISPKKTWEGALGGALLAMAISYPIAHFYTVFSFTHWCIIGLIVAVIGNYGDLIESLYKRSKNIKDSGTLLPGHGGILDRIDSLLMVIPFVTVYVYLFI